MNLADEWIAKNLTLEAVSGPLVRRNVLEAAVAKLLRELEEYKGRPSSGQTESVGGEQDRSSLAAIEEDLVALAYAGAIDAVRKALGQKETHYLVVADGVKELVEAVKLCESDGGCRAMTVLRKLRER